MAPVCGPFQHTSFPLLRCDDLRTLEQAHNGEPLTERAGEAAARVALDLARSGAPILVIAGPGNNGGDALVVARRLVEAGRAVVVNFIGDAHNLPIDARNALARWRAAGRKTHSAIPAGLYSLVIDGLFGIGLKRPITGIHADLIERINGFRATGGPVLALDIPSGLDADSGAIHGVAVRASHTATFIADKPGLHTLDGPDCAGTISVHPLGIVVAAKDSTQSGATLSIADFAPSLRPRLHNSHKGSNGSLALIGGNSGMCGAALLAARAGLHLGAGRIFVGLLDAQHPAVDFAQAELMLRSPEDAAANATTLVVGPGMGVDQSATDLLRRLASADFPMLLDADALTIASTHPVIAEHLRRRAATTLLTPHPAEAARLLGCSTAEIQSDRVAAALRIAQTYNACVALKGCGTVLARADGTWRINLNGNPGLATGGTGDVLAGIAGALLAQGWPGWDALCAAVFIHGAAADRLVAQGLGPVGLTASELILPARTLLNELIAARLLDKPAP